MKGILSVTLRGRNLPGEMGQAWGRGLHANRGREWQTQLQAKEPQERPAATISEERPGRSLPGVFRGRWALLTPPV